MPTADELRALFEAKARAELAEADAAVPGADEVRWDGDPLARTFLVKGSPGEADRREGRALAGPDGDAAAKALEALGIDPRSVFATCSRPAENASSPEALRRLGLEIEAVDPARVIALDREAADDVAAAVGVDPLVFGELAIHRGRALLAVDDLERSLTEAERKKTVWGQFKALGAI